MVHISAKQSKIFRINDTKKAKKFKKIGAVIHRFAPGFSRLAARTLQAVFSMIFILSSMRVLGNRGALAIGDEENGMKMKRKAIYLSIILILCCLQGTALADYYSRQFGDMDLSEDDYVDFEEYRYYVSAATSESFRKIDTSSDGKIDFFEWVEFQEKDYPFESKSNFKYRGKSGIWYLDHNGNRYKDSGRYYWGCRHDCRFDDTYDYRCRHRYGVYRNPCCHPMRSGWGLGFGILYTH